MARRVDGSLGTLLYGISQQPAEQRLTGQVSDQVNMTSDVLRMLHRRPPTQFVAQDTIPLTESTSYDSDATFVHAYDRNDGEQYFLIIRPNETEPTVYDAQGNKYATETNVTFGNYVQSDNPRRDLRAVTVGDYTFLVNKTKEVQADTDDTEWPTTLEGKVIVRSEQYSRQFNLRIRGTTTSGSSFSYAASHTTPTSTDTGAETGASAENTAAGLQADLIANGSNTHFGLIARDNEMVVIPNSNVRDYYITAEDSTGGEGMQVVTNRTVVNLADLPSREKPNAIYRVTGGAGAADDIYMRLTVNGKSETDGGDYYSQGIWVESSIDHPTKKRLFSSTMPMLLARVNDGAETRFLCGPAGSIFSFDSTEFPDWAPRLVGDKESNKFPDFVGSTLQDIATFQDRLVLIYTGGVAMSVTSDFFNFFKKTVTTLLDDGPIGLSAAGVTVNNLLYSQLHNQDLVVFAEKVQYLIRGTVAITPSNATMPETTQFRVQTDIRPAPSGQTLFFAVNSGVYSGVREFYTDSDLNSNNARPITVAVERLIRGKIRVLASSTNTNKLVAVADDPSTMYIYEYLWEDNERIQSAWSKWTIGPDLEIVHLEFLGDQLYVLAQRKNSASVDDLLIFRADISQDATQTFLEGDILLDSRTEVPGTGAFVESADIEWMLKAENATSLDRIRVVQGEGCPYPGMGIKIRDFDIDPGTGTYKINLQDDMQGGTVLVGYTYESSVTPTMPFIKDDSENAIGTSQLTVGAMKINFADAGDFDVEVTYKYGESYTERNPGRVMGAPSAVIGDYILTSGQFNVPVRARNIDADVRVYTDSIYPITITDVEWDGQFYKRGRRV